MILELQSYQNRWKNHLRTSAENHRNISVLSKQGKKSSSPNDGLFSQKGKIYFFIVSRFVSIDLPDQKNNQLPLDVTDYKVRFE